MSIFSKRDIPCQSYQMHTLHCARNIALCDICDEPIPKREFEEHKKECPISKEDTEAPTSNSSIVHWQNGNIDSSTAINHKPTSFPAIPNKACSQNGTETEKVHIIQKSFTVIDCNKTYY